MLQKGKKFLLLLWQPLEKDGIETIWQTKHICGNLWHRYPVMTDIKPINVENTEGAVKSGQSRETGNIGYIKRKKTKQKHNTICVGTPNKQAQIM